MELAGYPPAHSCQFCQQFVIEFDGDVTTSSKHPIDGLQDARVREALRSRRFDQAPEVLEALREYHIFDYSVTDLDSAPQACPLADMFRKSIPVAQEYMPLQYPPEQTVLMARGAVRDNGLSFGALEIREGQFVGPDMKETTLVEYSTAANFDVVKVPGASEPRAGCQRLRPKLCVLGEIFKLTRPIF